MKRFYKNQSAFTLIELLVTVAVMAVLAGLAVSNVSEYKKKAYHVVAIHQARDLITAGQAALIDNISASVTISSTGTTTVSGGYTLAQAFPGFQHAEGVWISGSATTVWATHCKGPVIFYSGSYYATISAVCTVGDSCWTWVVHPGQSGCSI